MADTIEIFVSCAEEDEELRKELENQLKPLKWKGFVTLWHARDVTPGTEIAPQIEAHLNSARIILLLISPNFLASDYLYNSEMKRAMARHNAGKALVIPVLLRPVHWEDEPFGKLRLLPDNKQAVTSWHSKGDAFFNVAEGIRKAIEGLSAKPLVSPAGANQVQDTSGKPLAERKEDVISANDRPLTAGQPATQPSTSATQRPEHFDVFLSYSHLDAEWVERLAGRLGDEHGFRVWLDKWVLVPGQSWQQDMVRGIDQAGCCAVCIGENTPVGWFKREIERALDRQTKVPSFRVIPVLLPSAKRVNVDDFLELNTWVDFRGSDQDYAFHVLVCGVKGIPPGRWPRK